MRPYRGVIPNNGITRCRLENGVLLYSSLSAVSEAKGKGEKGDEARSALKDIERAIEEEKNEMALNQQRSLRWPCSIVLVIYLLSIWAIPSESGDSYPTQHGLAQEKDPGEASPAMETFFRGRPEVALPMAQNITKPVLGLAVRAAPKEPAHSGSQNYTRAALLITGVVCGVVGLVLLGIVVVAYAIHAHRSKNWSGAHLSAGMTRFRSSPKARLGGATREVI